MDHEISETIESFLNCSPKAPTTTTEHANEVNGAGHGLAFSSMDV